MRALLAIVAFIGLYAAADYLGGLIPAWVGVAVLLGAIAGCIVLIVKIGRSI